MQQANQYLPSPSQPPINPLKWLIWVILLLVLGAILNSCSIGKRQQRLDEKAVNRVNANALLQQRVVSPYMDAHPQDTTPKVFVDTPKIITVPIIKLVKDTTGRQHLIDSVKQAHEKDIDCGNASANAFDLGYEQAEKYYLDNPIKAKCPPDTTKLYYMTSQVRRWQDSSHLKDKQISYHKGREEAISEQTDKTIRQNNKLWVAIILLVLGAVLSHVARSYLSTFKLPNIKLPKLN